MKKNAQNECAKFIFQNETKFFYSILAFQQVFENLKSKKLAKYEDWTEKIKVKIEVCKTEAQFLSYNSKNEF